MSSFETPFDADEEVPEEGVTLDNVTLLDKHPLFRIPRGKYQGLLLPRMLGVKPTTQDKVEALKRAIASDPDFRSHATALAATYTSLRRERAELAEQLSEVNLRILAVSQMMADQFEVEDCSGLNLIDVRAKVRVQPEPRTVVLDKEEFRRWCIEAGLERSMVLPWSSANKLVKDRLLSGLDEPTGVAAHMNNKIFFTDLDKKKVKE